MFSIYGAIYRIGGPDCFIDWRAALDNFTAFAEEVCISTTTFSNDNTIDLLKEYAAQNNKIKLVITDLSFDLIDFDGRLKDAALKACTEPFCILLDGDEYIRIADKPNWVNLANYLHKLDYDALFIPVIDLFNTEREYKSLGRKWYIHKNLENLQRGVVDFAWVDDAKTKIRINQSDTCELCYNDNTLCKTLSLIDKLTLFDIDNLGAKIFHTGWISKEKRLLANGFWSNVWSNRAGYKVNNIIQTKEELEQIEYWPHKLKLWYE